MSIVDVDQPDPGPGEVVVRVVAAAIRAAGSTAYAAVLAVLKAGETVVAAAGGVGIIAAQLGLLAGARVIGAAGDFNAELSPPSASNPSATAMGCSSGSSNDGSAAPTTTRPWPPATPGARVAPV